MVDSKYQFRTIYNADLTPREIDEKNKPGNITTPGQSYGIKELLEKNRLGLSPTVQKTPQYEEESEIDINRLDPTLSKELDIADIPAIKEELEEKFVAAAKKKEAKAKAAKDNEAKQKADEKAAAKPDEKIAGS